MKSEEESRVKSREVSGLRTQHLIHSVKFHVIAGTLSFQELAAVPAFAALPVDGQRMLIAKLRRTIIDAKLDNGVIDIFERVKCLDRSTGPMCTYVEDWLSAGHEERRASLLKFACHVRQVKQLPVILVQHSSERPVDIDAWFMQDAVVLVAFVLYMGFAT